MVNNLIQWPTAKYWTAQWNPIIGCKPCSPACENCYAAAWAKRFGQSFVPHKSSQDRPPRKGIVFCGNMTDLAGEWRTVEDLAENISECIMPTKKDAEYLWLTKRVERMCDAMHYVGDRLNLPDLWFKDNYFGFTAENQEWYDRRIKEFRGCMPHWANGWLSAEPLLGPINLGLQYIAPEDMPFEWVVVGCESGQNRRPCKIEWVESIVEKCIAANVPVFVKQICLPNGKFTNKIEEFPSHLQVRQVPWATKGETK